MLSITKGYIYAIFLTLVFLPSAFSVNTLKRGLAFHNPTEYIQDWNGASSQVNWAYNWGSTTDSAFPKYLEYVPMLWGNQFAHTNSWIANANLYISHGTHHLLSFNEPDGCGPGQACITPHDAANSYKEYMQPFAGRALLGAPAVTNGPDGIIWLDQFLQNCTGCQIDFVSFHWYDTSSSLAFGRLQAKVGQMHAANGGSWDVWITEFHGSGTVAQQMTLMQQAMPWLDAQSYVSRYAWQWCDPSAGLVASNGVLTALGNTYAYTPY